MADETDNVIRVNFGGAPPPEDEPAEGEFEANEEKLRVFSELVDEGTVMVTFDARQEGVLVPAEHSDNLRLNLNFCHLFEIPDFDYDVRGVRASLSFGGRDFYCEVPWHAVYMMRSHVRNDFAVFPASLPEEVLATIPPPVLAELQALDDD